MSVNGDVVDALTTLAEIDGGLVRVVLPKGKQGRQDDDLYRISFHGIRLGSQAHQVMLVLDEQWILIMTEPVLVAASATRVQLSFQQATLELRETVGRPNRDTWRSGLIEVHTPLPE